MDERKWKLLEGLWSELPSESFCLELMDKLHKMNVISDEEMDRLDYLGNPQLQWKTLVGSILPDKANQNVPENFLGTITELDAKFSTKIMMKFIATPTNTPEKSIIIDVELIEKVVAYESIMPALTCMKDFNLSHENMKTLQQCRDAIFKHIQREAGDRLTVSKPPISNVEDLIEDFKAKKRKFSYIVKKIEVFCNNGTNQSVLRCLGLTNHLQLIKQSESNDLNKTPSFLVAGTTSSGKSTLINALLGQDVLPTSYSAATSAICEVRYSPSGKKFAKAEIKYQPQNYVEEKEFDLSNKEEVDEFSQYVNTHTTGSDFKGQCSKATVFWPADILKKFSLVDSPGVTEKSSSSVARQITESFQKDLASGFIYVLDATRAAEDAAEVGGLLSSISEVFPIPGAALFILNKWDLFQCQQDDLSQNQTLEKKDEYLAKIRKGLIRNWRGLKFEEQVLEMNAKLAYQAGQFGVTTSKMKSLFQGIRRVVKQGIQFQILQTIKPYKFNLDEIGRRLFNQIKILKLCFEDRKKFFELQKQYLQSLKKSMKSGEIFDLQQKVKRKMQEAACEVSDDLLKEEIKTKVMNSNCLNVKEMLHKGLSLSPAFRTLFEWLQTEFFKEVRELALKLFKDDDDQPLPILIKLLDATNRKIEEGNAVTINSLIGQLVLWMMRLFNFIPSEEKYVETVEKWRENNFDQLISSMFEISREKVTSVKVLFVEVEEQISDIESVLEAGLIEQTKTDLSRYEATFKSCRVLQEKIAESVMQLDMHEYDVADIELAETPQSCPKFVHGSRVKVSLPCVGTALMRIENVTKETAKDLLILTEKSKLIKNDHLLMYYGSSWLIEGSCSANLGLLYEYLPFTLAENIFTERYQSLFVKGSKTGTYAMISVLKGLRYLHENLHLAHRQLQPQNVWLSADAETIKLGEIGIGKLAISSAAYLAPEAKLQGDYSSESDMYSFGTLLWETWHGEHEIASQPSVKDFNSVWADLAKMCWETKCKRPTAGAALEKMILLLH